ncbi:hypothetical protein [Streptomyces melanogenes]|uniref:hypothetical protein n=1 Tax=Streptomyces melanogenes TaxID=67326 RepID=UPI0037B38811
MTRAVPQPNAGVIDDLAALHRLVRHLTADGDRRAARAGRHARRTLAEMTTIGQGR